ncbi:glycosyl transferase [Carnimonas nigrificans]|uniref:glycosyl transferase n=1 Tax=Carnimonas nigrificans TaxID=64323 RepID=UPI000470CFDC|nr:glycosyl transferase [Carnimonas nigrificans]
MSDFHQDGVITTLHSLADRPVESLEEELKRFSRSRPMGLIIPSLFSELEGPALSRIVDELAQVPYLTEITIGLDRADRDQFNYAREFFSRLPQRHRILWNDGPRLRELDEELQSEGLSPTEPGKGRNVWFCSGYTLASRRTAAVALHDADILTYRRDMLARLLYPIVHPRINYEFCKGYYARVSGGQLNGRVGRLLVTPLLRAMQSIYGPSEYLDYLSSYRYPLSGEFAMHTDVLSNIRIPSDWGLEIGVLSEVHRNYGSRRLCQVDIADNYDHKHQPLSEDDRSAGLSRMAQDITKALFRKLSTLGVQIPVESLRTLKATYYRTALDMIENYYHDALINGLTLDRHAEEATVELFTQVVSDAGVEFLETPRDDKPFIPSWNRIQSALPDHLQKMYEAVELDNKGEV